VNEEEDDEDEDYYSSGLDPEEEKKFHEKIEAIKREAKERGLSHSEATREVLSFIREYAMQTLSTHAAILRANMPYIMKNEKLRRKITKIHNEMIVEHLHTLEKLTYRKQN
jgi:hypothetical protein